MTFRAVVMAGGRGSRLGHLAEGRPKALLPLGQGHVLGRLLDQLTKGGCGSIDLCLGFQAEQIMQNIGISWRGVPVTYRHEKAPLGTAGALCFVRGQVGGDAWPLDTVVVNCDIVAEIDFADLVARHRHHGGAASVVTARFAQTLRYGTIDAAGDGCAVTAVREKPQSVHRVIAGIYLFQTKALTKALANAEGRLDMPELLLRFLGQDGALTVNLDLQGDWIDVGVPEDYSRAREMFG